MMSRDLLAAIHQQFNNRPEAVAIEWGGRMLSYQQLAGAVAETAGALRRGGQAPVAFFLEPCPALVVNLTACLFTGHVFAPLNPMLPDPVLRQMLTRVAPSVIMTIPTLAERTYALAAQLDPVPEVRVCDPVGLNMEPNHCSIHGMSLSPLAGRIPVISTLPRGQPVSPSRFWEAIAA